MQQKVMETQTEICSPRTTPPASSPVTATYAASWLHGRWATWVSRGVDRAPKGGPKFYQMLTFLWVLSDCMPFIWQKTAVWIPLMTSGTNFSNNYQELPTDSTPLLSYYFQPDIYFHNITTFISAPVLRVRTIRQTDHATYLYTRMHYKYIKNFRRHP